MSASSDDDQISQTRAAAQASLDRVLSTLEEMLQIEDTMPKPEPAGAEQPAAEGEFGQLSIPLLDDVIGTDQAHEAAYGTGDELEIPSELDVDPELVEEISRRLRNELEVIIQAGLERLTKKATSEIMSEVKIHLDIILPEIIADIDAPPDEEDDD